MSEMINGHSFGNSREANFDDTTDRDPVEELASEFADRLRVGERVSVEKYATQYPQYAEQIRDLFPTIVAVEQLNTKRLTESNVSKPVMPEQLGDYRILGEIARGGMGIVYEAEQVSLGRRVAVKVLPTQVLRSDRDVRRFEREAQTAAGLHHSNIVPVFGIGEENGQRYIVMQLIRGVGLDEILSEIKETMLLQQGVSAEETRVASSRITIAKRSAVELLASELKLDSTVNGSSPTLTGSVSDTSVANAPVPEPEIQPIVLQSRIGDEYFRNVARIGLQASEALQYAHQNDTLHRDIKPGNLLLDNDGRIWIADFGLAKALQDDDVTCSGDVVGTMAYVAPERFRGETTKSSDIYSLGVTLHEMLTLKKAFDGADRVAVMNQVTNERLPSPRRINRAVPRDLETIVLKAAAQDPKDRYASAARLAADLQAFLEDRPIEARRLSYVEHVVRWGRRNPGVASLASAVVVLIAAVFGLLVFGYQHADRQRARAEAISQSAIGALDEIYSRFAFTPLAASLDAGEMDDGAEVTAAPHMPISKDVASLLENLLEFYDELSVQTENSDAVTLKYIAANCQVGDIQRRLGQQEDARASYQAAITRLNGLAPSLRDTTAMRLETARAHNGIGLTYPHWSWVHSKDRVESHEAAVAILDHQDSTDNEKFELATSLYLLHNAVRHRNWSLRRRGGGVSAASIPERIYLERARDILAELKQGTANRPEVDLLMARCLVEEWGSSSLDDATFLPNELQAIAILESLIERFPDNPDYQYELGKLYERSVMHANWNRRRKPSDEQLAGVESRLRKGLLTTEGLEIQHPNIPQYYLLKKHLHERLGDTLRRQHRNDEAVVEYEKAIQMQQLLIQSGERPETHVPWLLALQIDYAKSLRCAGELQQAKATLEEASTKLETLLSEVGEIPRDGFRQREYRDNVRRLQSAYREHVNVLQALGDADDAQAVSLKLEALEE